MKSLQHLLTGALSIIIFYVVGVLVFTLGPIYEGRLFPLVKDVRITLVEENLGVGMQTFTVVATKVRDCDVRAMKVLVGESKDDILHRANFALKPDGEPLTHRAKGTQVYEGVVIGRVGNYVRIDTVHHCHGLWDTIFSPWGEWERGKK